MLNYKKNNIVIALLSYVSDDTRGKLDHEKQVIATEWKRRGTASMKMGESGIVRLS